MQYLLSGNDYDGEIDELKDQVEVLKDALENSVGNIERLANEIHLLKDLLAKSDMRFELLLKAMIHHDRCPTKCWGHIDGEDDIKSLGHATARINSAVNKVFKRPPEQS